MDPRLSEHRPDPDGTHQVSPGRVQVSVVGQMMGRTDVGLCDLKPALLLCVLVPAEVQTNTETCIRPIT